MRLLLAEEPYIFHLGRCIGQFGKLEGPGHVAGSDEGGNGLQCHGNFRALQVVFAGGVGGAGVFNIGRAAFSEPRSDSVEV